jgi:molybdate transport system substrate-binding protein
MQPIPRKRQAVVAPSIAFFIGAIVLASAFSSARAADEPPVAAAADLKFALTEVAKHFAQDTGGAVKPAFGSSGNFTHQIEQGAPFELFLSADETYIFRLAEKGLTVDRGALYAIGRLVLFAPHGSALQVDSGLKDLKAALADGRVRRFAIANPDHAPYGRAARAALHHAGLWTVIEGRLVFGENASQAMQFAASGSSQGGIVPLSLSKAEEIARLGTFALIPAEWHADEPLRQRMALTKSAGATARAFYDYLQKPAARDVFARYGFTLPGEGAGRGRD